MLRCQFLCHVLKALFFIEIALKLSYICQKMQNLRALGFRPQTPVPQPPGSQNSPPPPDCEFLATRLNMLSKRNYPSIVLFFYNNSCIFQIPISGRVDRASVTEAVDYSSSIPGRIKTKTIKIGIHSFSA